MYQDRRTLLASIASRYYEDQRSQAQIAAETGYSRSMVSRLLTEAREEGVVEIRINHPLQRRADLEAQLQDILQLQTVQVLTAGALTHGQMLERLGSLAARVVEDLLDDAMTLGVSWGTAVWETVRALRPTLHSNMTVVQMIGALDTQNPDIDGPEIARRLGRTVAGRVATLLAPLFVESATVRQALLHDPQIQRVAALFAAIDLAVVGVGTVLPEQASLLRAGYLSVAQLAALRDAQAVGDVCALHFDSDGRLVDTPITRRIVGIDAATLARIPTIIGVAGGPYKSASIIGASRAKLITTLITDDVAATHIVQQLRHRA